MTNRESKHLKMTILDDGRVSSIFSHFEIKQCLL